MVRRGEKPERISRQNRRTRLARDEFTEKGILMMYQALC